jgi:ABC-type glycerol-3-phosphate transport system substrate-binding protein
VIQPFSTEPTLRAKTISGSRRPAGLLIAALLIAGLGAAGCGGSSSKTTSSSASTAAAPVITKAAFVAKANEICGKADPVLSEANAKLATHPPTTQVVAVVKSTYVPSIEAQITGIKALGVPSGDQAAVTRMLTLVQADLNKLKSNPALVATDVFGDFARVAHPYGLTACAPIS